MKKFIFSSALKKNLIFSMNQSVKDFLITKLDLVMCPPEEIKVQQGDPSTSLYLIAKGECECYVRDEFKR